MIEFHLILQAEGAACCAPTILSLWLFLCFGAQLETLNLASGGLRQVVDEFDPARVFVGREPAFHVLLKIGGKRRRLRVSGRSTT